MYTLDFKNIWSHCSSRPRAQRDLVKGEWLSDVSQLSEASLVSKAACASLSTLTLNLLHYEHAGIKEAVDAIGEAA
jgi:hypothetical protein